MAQSCNFKTTLDSTKAWLRTRGFIDENMRIKTSLSDFNSQVGILTSLAKDKYSVDQGPLFTTTRIDLPRLTGSPYYRTGDNISVYKAVPNMMAFDTIESLKLGRKYSKVDYQFKIESIIGSNLDKITKLYQKIGNTDQFWDKLQKDFQIPKTQVILLRESYGSNIEEKIASFSADYTYPIEITRGANSYYMTYDNYPDYLADLEEDPNTKPPEFRYEIIDQNGKGVFKSNSLLEVESRLDEFQRNAPPVNAYSNLTVPGGTQYTENEIAVPDVVPSIKGHAQFATKNGIGWFRSDEQRSDDNTGKRVSDGAGGLIQLGQVGSKTRRVLEVQSDLFQKGRDKEYLTKDTPEAASGIYENLQNRINKQINKENQFLQLLNKDNNWVTFFIKSIIQDSAKKGYEKVLFPSGNTAAKVEGHTTLEEFKREKENRIQTLYKNIEVNKKQLSETPDLSKLSEKGRRSILDGSWKIPLIEGIKKWEQEIKQIEQELERVEREGFGALKPIYNFYENVVGNILKKQGYKPTLITDEYGNTWNEVVIDSTRDNEKVLAMSAEIDPSAVKGYINETLKRSKEIFTLLRMNKGETYSLKEVMSKLKGIVSKTAFSTQVHNTIIDYLDKLETKIVIQDELNNISELGYYQQSNNTIYLGVRSISMWHVQNKLDIFEGSDKARKGVDYENLENFIHYILLHEIMHAFTTSRIRQYNLINVPLDSAVYAKASNNADPTPLGKEEEKAIANLKEIYFYVRDHIYLNGEYGVTNLDEFISEAMSNRDFAEKLKNIPLPPTTTISMGSGNVLSAIKKIINYIIALFTGKVSGDISTYDYTRHNIDRLLETFNPNNEDFYTKDVTKFNNYLGGDPVFLRDSRLSILHSTTGKVSTSNKEYRDLTGKGPYEVFLSSKPISTDIKSVVNRLNQLFPQMQVKYISDADKNYIPGANAYVKGNTVYVQEDVDSTTMIEEFLHPFVNAMASGNKSLFNSLITQAKSQFPEIVESVNKEYTDKKGFNESDRDQEIVTKAISIGLDSEFSENPVQIAPKSFSRTVNRFINWLYNTLRKIFGDRFKPFGLYAEFLPTNITLKELASILNENTSYVYSFSEDRKYSLKKEQADMVNELENLYNEPNKLNSVLEDFFNITENHIFRLRQNKNYDKLKEALSNADGSNRYVDLKSLLKDAKDKTDSVEDMRFKMRQISNSLIFIDELGGKMVKIAEDLNKDSSVDIREKVSRLRYYMQLANNWEQFLDLFGKDLSSQNTALNNVIGRARSKFRALENIVLNNDKSGVIDVLEEALGGVRKTIDSLYTAEVKKLKDKIAAGDNVKSNKLLLANREAEWKKFNLSKDNLIKFINGEYGDTNMFSAMFEAYISSPDPVVGGFAKFIKTNFYDVEYHLQQTKTKMLNELDPLLKNYDQSNPRELGEKITFKDSVSGYDSEGNLIKDQVLSYLSEFKDYRYEISRLQNELAKANESGDPGRILTAKQEYDRVRISYMHNEYLPEYYNRQNIFNQGYGPLAKIRRDEILSDIKQKQFEINNKLHPNEEDVKDLDTLWRRYRALHSTFDLITGEKKTGDDLEVALLLQEYRNNSREYYEWTEMKGAYERARTYQSEELLSAGLTEDSEAYKEGMKSWEDANTRVVVSEEFYKNVRDPLIQVLEALSAKLPNNTGKKENLGKVWRDLIDQSTAFRDEDGQIDASVMTESKIRKSRELEESIKRIKDSYISISGLTKQQSALRSQLYDKLYESGLTPSEEATLDELNNLSTLRGLTKAEKKVFLDTIRKLDQIQTRRPSEYYIDAMNEKLREYGQSLPAEKYLGYINSGVMQEILSKDVRFKAWFEDNHILEEKFDAEGNSTLEYRPLYIWTKTVPRDSKYMEKIPSSKYMKREVKEEYRTKRVVGETVDNKGDWLPRRDALGSPFINEAYSKLKKDDPTAFKILEITKKYFLKEQEGLGRQHRLYLDVPRVRKSRLEGLREGDVKEKSLWAWNQLKQRIKPQKDDYSEDLGNYDPIMSSTTKVVSTDMFSNELIMAPIRYTSKIPLETQSYDVIGSALKYMQSAAMNKKLVEINPIAQAFKEVLQKEGVKDTSKMSKYHLFKKKERIYANKDVSQYSRLKAISNLIEREFEGVENKMELTEYGHKAADNLMRISALTSLALDIPSAFKNLFSAHMQNLIESVGRDFITTEDWWRGNGIFLKTYMKDLVNDNYKIGNKSIYTQMFQLFDPIQGKFLDSFGRELSASKLQDFVAGSWMFAPRQFGELEAQGSLFLGAMSRITVDQTLPDGTKKRIRYLDAFELGSDGVIKLKDGVDPEYAPTGNKFKEFKLKLHEVNQRLQGNYAKVDKPEIERYTTGRLLVFLRKYLVPAFVNRFAPTRINIGLGSVSEGYYQSFAKMTKNLFKTGKLNWKSYTENERRNYMKTVAELAISKALALILLIMGFDEEDPEKFSKLENNSWLYNHALYQIMMMKSEEEQFIPWIGMGVNELQRIKNTPSIAFGQMDRYVVFANDIWSDLRQPFNEEDLTHFQRTTGFWDEGDRKDVAHFLRILGFTGSTISPEAAVRNYYLMSTRTK